MNEHELIEQLKQLKKFEPTQQTLSILESRIKAEQSRPVFHLRESFFRFYHSLRLRPVLAYGITAIFILLISVIAGWGLFTEPSQMAFVRARIALTSNKYEKARLSLSLSQSQLDILQKSKATALNSQLTYLQESTSRTDAFIHSLNLKGEPGKYTAQQCLSIYKEYDDYLEGLKNTIQNKTPANGNQSTQAKLQSLLNQISQYEQNAEAELRLY